ncbi:class II aldolase/adducin family protein [Caldimonas thermodepolymerans]|jgi:ribulose-5-phosphate 4-epimerase/fuculose-1-phosphate aldolase|uniref:Class II aldolase/adducin family protein n=1 Tax=Caldimonas thermodepolymerans TaxID=215580 RepID=A0A2S5T3Z1_9BURK|nr:class II aldolase/adducin family protein [Caldimonas thermodepolymerans]PPE69704.1 class II aldolase/adducin family protein [Caldimonas thermodepolymerans]QPC31885.1 class II aldolase/adducin family protein [Caldimonas thermodepolymerans]RDI01600.1 ribulose-5-phosphate 4-epimerase/fuculose-1-phosphate aldolase [Caldimonas thermodepolymerans]
MTENLARAPVTAVKLAGRESIYQPEQPGLKFPSIPTFETKAQQRQYLKERLVAACRAFAQHGLDYGFAGHLTVRDPEFPELYWTNPMAVHFAQVKVSNLILVDHKGKVLEGGYAVNRAGFVLHAAVHAANPDIVAMCHAHTEYGTAFAALGKPLAPLSQDAAAFFEDHVVIREEAGQVAVETQAGSSVCDKFRGVKAAIHQNHGLFTVSRHSIDSAAFWFIALERCCKQQLMIEATGQQPVLVSPERSRYSREHVGSEYIGWLHFQPIYEHLAATQPDMFE